MGLVISGVISMVTLLTALFRVLTADNPKQP